MVGIIGWILLFPLKVLFAYLKFLFFIIVTMVILGILGRLAVVWFLNA